MFSRQQKPAWILAAEPDVVSIFRGRTPRQLVGSPAGLPPVHAYVVVIQSEGGQRVFAALHLKEQRRNLIYEVSSSAGGAVASEPLLESAFPRLEEHGFDLEEVKLRFGTAMREVIIRDIPVLLPPAALAKAETQRAEELTELRSLAAAAEKGAGEDEEGRAVLSPNRRAIQERTRRERLAVAQVAAQRVAEEEGAEALLDAIDALFDPAGNVAGLPAAALETVADQAISSVVTELAEDAGVELPENAEAELAVLTVETTPPGAEKAQPEASVAGRRFLKRQGKIMAKAARMAAEKSRSDRAEMERLLALQAEAERQAELANAQIAALARTGEELSADRERLAGEMREAEARAADLAAAMRASEERAVADRLERDSLVAAKREAERWSAELVGRVSQVEGLLAVERTERERLAGEQAQAQRRLQELSDAARLAETRALAEKGERERLAAEKAVNEQLLAEKAALEQTARELARTAQLATQRAEAEKAERERLAAERVANEQLRAEKAALEKRAQELTRTAQLATQRAAAEKAERQQLAAAKKIIEERLEAVQKQPLAAKAIEERPASPPASSPSSSLRPMVGANRPRPARRGGVAGAFFQVDWDREQVDCDPVRDIIEVQQSFSMAPLSLEGFPSQYCSAYIVGFKKGGGREVNVVFHLKQSGRLLVYVPGKPISDQSGYARGMQEAQKFLQVVGMDTERMSLGNAPAARARSLAALPLFRSPDRSVEGF